MLVMTRKRNQVIVIGDEIIVKVIDIINGEYVKIGIEAPKNISIHRLEIYNAIVKENIQGQKNYQKVNKTSMSELNRLFQSKVERKDIDPEPE